jgi:hypothetical protein
MALCLHLRAIESDPAELDHAGLAAQAEAVEEERREGGQMATPELADRLVAGAGLAGEEHEADVTTQTLLELARAGDPGGVAVQEDLEHQRRVVGRHPPGLVVGGQEGRQVELLDEHVDEGRQAVGGDPVTHAGRHQQEGVLVVGRKVLLRMGDSGMCKTRPVAITDAAT